ncbi:uncharacterized protein (DUF58 family) [Gramella sp. Hel_I_59]|uniref:DUF58 domain-containing protein n=1 Tax=Gramella sp. Hel_I_59 TaxID=1249978 RepID=UPI00114DD7A1|nr:DUF58 domain-containing protein [Gramella sp. Hel_I_59]TQI71049.1 uncharacterized protein (DUF58 family) [Gramella sp. Hel_I_59]
MLKFLKSLYFKELFFYCLIGIAVLFLISFWVDWLYSITWIISMILAIATLLDIIALYSGKAVLAERILPEKFSNSDPNQVILKLRNNYRFPVTAEVIDEVPLQFQKRDFLKSKKLGSRSEEKLEYQLIPLERGEYIFGNLNIYISSKLGLVRRRYITGKEQSVKVYPSFVQMKKLDFLALDQKINLQGMKRIRRIGHTMEFEQIKEYVRGDDVRTINWKATAKQNALMVNQFQDERSQPVYIIIDTGRVMRMPFEGLSLLDYAINSSLAFSNIALRKKDKVGLLSFSNKVHAILKASSRLGQLQQILESLYRVDTGYLDSDFSMLYSRVQKSITHRSLIMLYTNFEHMSALQRQLPYLKAISKKHLLVVIFFENTEITGLTEQSAEKDISTMAHQTIAESFQNDKIIMVKELEKFGIQTILTPPKDLSINTINKYLEVKARGLI